MSNAIIGALRVSLGLDSAEFSKGLGKAQGNLSAFEAKMRNLGGKIAGVGAALSVAGAGIGLAIRGQINSADELSKAAQKFGIPIETLSKLKHAADLSDVSLEALGKSVGILSKAMVAAKSGNKAFAEKFAAIGVSVTDAAGKLRTSEAVMSDIADVLARMPDGAEKTALAMSLFGKSGADMIPLLNGGGSALHEMMVEAEKLGLVITQGAGTAAENFNDNVARLRASLAGLAIGVASALLPTLEMLSKKLVDLVKWFGQLSPGLQSTIAAVAGFSLVAGPMLSGLGGIILAVGMLSSAFVKLAAVILANPIVATIAAIAVGATLIYYNWDGIKEFFIDIWASVSASATQAWEATKAAWSNVTAYFNDLIFVELPKIFDAAWTAIKGKFTAWVEEFKQLGRNIMNGLTEGIVGSRDMSNVAISDAMGGLIGTAEDAVDSHSPSRVFQQIGHYIMQGLGLGITEGAPAVQATMDDVAKSLGKNEGLQAAIDSLRSSAQGAFSGLITGAQSLNEALGQVLDNLAQMLAQSAFDKLFGAGTPGGGIFDWLGGLMGFANGTPSSPGGLAMVGERGPELVNLPRGSQVFSAPETRAMMSDRGGGGVTISIDARGATEGTAEMIAKAISARTPEIVRQAVLAAPAMRKRGHDV